MTATQPDLPDIPQPASLNPTQRAFFFEDGDFLNLEYVLSARYSSSGFVSQPSTQLAVYMLNASANRYRECTPEEYARLRDALAVYHSNA